MHGSWSRAALCAALILTPLAVHAEEADAQTGEGLPAAAAAAPGAVTEESSKVRWYAIPNFAYDTDDGLGLGARGELAFPAPGHEPYHSAWMVHIFATTTGFHHHRLRYDRLGLGPGGRLRLTAFLAWRQWLNDSYYGMGNGTRREEEYDRSFDSDDPRARRYRYKLFQPFTYATLRARLEAPWSLFVSIGGKWSFVETYPGSLLEEQRPFGMRGGPTLTLSTGVLFDTRQPELTPEQGVYLELSGRFVAPLSPTGIGFGGVLAQARGYLSLSSWLVIAARIMAEHLWGRVPFYEMVHWGGAAAVPGFGGAYSVRGLPFGRFHAPGKAIANLEARFDVIEHGLFGRPLLWQLVPFADVGTVFGARENATAAEPSQPLHPSFGAGLHVVFDRTFVARIDAALGLDPVQRAAGIENEWAYGFYVVFDQTF